MSVESPSGPEGAAASKDLPRRLQALSILNEFARGMLRARSTDELLWDVAARTIARLGYEDCVIYLVDGERECLVQRAAHGPKNPRAHEIADTIELAFGQGIVGSVAASGRGEIVPDVSLDERYVVDDEVRASEMAVPIVHDGRVIGVLDSESSQPNAFDAEDLEIFETIASMLATRVATEQARDQVEAELRRASEVAEQANRERSAFLANVSHEIRTPLVAVLGIADMLDGLVDGGAPPEVVRDHLQVIRRSGEHLLDLINQLLDLTSTEQGKLRIQPRDTCLRSVVSEMQSLFLARAQELGLAFRVEIDPAVPKQFRTDPLRVRQVLVNLVDNAMKFTAAGSIHLQLTTDPEQESRVICTVRDTGCGVPQDRREAIFESFVQVDDSLARQHGGLGLGLAISRRLAERMGGDLTLVDEEAPGACFRLTLAPLPAGEGGAAGDARQASAEDAAASASLPARTLRLLLAEDNLASRRLMTFQLEQDGHDVVSVADGEDALQAARTPAQPFDAVLLDMQMPRRDGFDVARTLRAEDYRGPIIALTAHSFPGDREQCLAAGCDDHLSKPFDWVDLYRRIDAASSQ